MKKSPVKTSRASTTTGKLKTVPKRKGFSNQENSYARLRNGLSKWKKDALVDRLLELAEEDRKLLRQLETDCKIEAGDAELVDDTRIAIADATDFDQRQINYNFEYDSEAYEQIENNFRRLANSKCWKPLMELALELMRQASYQIECSDEGQMLYEVEACLNICIKALAKSSLDCKEIVAWCDEMLRHDRVGFICDRELKSLPASFLE